MNQIQQLLLWAIGSLRRHPADHHRITRETFRAAYPTQSDKNRIAAAQAKRERETFRAAYPTQSDKDRIAAAQAKRERKNAKRLK